MKRLIKKIFMMVVLCCISFDIFAQTITCTAPNIPDSTGTSCITPATCTAGYVLDVSNNTCVIVPTCTETEILNVFTNTCVDPATCTLTNGYVINIENNVCEPAIFCQAPQVINQDSNTCVEVEVCTEGYFLDSSSNTCVLAVECQSPLVLDRPTNTCTTPAVCLSGYTVDVDTNTCVLIVSCTAPQVRDIATNTCVNPVVCNVNEIGKIDPRIGYVFDPITSSCIFNPIPADPALAVGIEAGTSYTLTVGFNPLSTNHDRLYGSDGVISDWSVSYRLAGQTCDLSTNEITPDGFLVNTVDHYINKSYPDCSVPDLFDYTMEDPRSLPLSDPLYSLNWIDFGLVPDPAGTTETIKCKFNETCEVTSTKNEYQSSLLTLSPTAGATALSAGSTKAFIYNYRGLSYSNQIGVPGLGGKANLPKPLPSSVKYCYIKHDATTEQNLVNSDFARNPTLDFLKINWQPFIEGPTANDGQPGTSKNGKTTVIKGLDSSMRYWLGTDNVLNKK